MKILLTGARIIDPVQNIDADMDILLEDSGKIVRIGADILKSVKSKDSGKIKIIELAGMILVRIQRNGRVRHCCRSRWRFHFHCLHAQH